MNNNTQQQNPSENDITFSSSMSEAVNYNRWVIDIFRPFLGKSVLEVGIGHGGFYELVKDDVEEYAGVDIDEGLVKHARSINPGQKYYHADITDPELVERLPHKFDSILCINVIEHIEQDRLAAENMLSLLNPGGHLLLFTPAFMKLYTDMDKLAGHHRRYTKQTISDIIPEENCEITKLRYFNSVGGIAWWMNKFTTHSSLESKNIRRQVIIFDKIVLPVSKFCDIFMRRFFGQSVICIVKRK